MLFLRLEAEVDGQQSKGTASDLLPPKWFTKVADDSLDKEIAGMLKVIRCALKHAIGLESPTAFSAWKKIYQAQSEWAQSENIPSLLAHFGTSLVERALIESVCRSKGKALGAALRDGTLGFEPGAIHPTLEMQSPATLLRKDSLASVIARHTVGLADPLASNEIPEGERLDDALPQSLDQCIQAYGIRHFKIKMNGNADPDLERLQHISSIIDKHATSDFAFSLDGNEQFESVESFRLHWERLISNPKLAEFFGHLLFVEQPLHRNIALNDSVNEGFNKWTNRPPIIIDESDATTESLPEALGLGYAGTSHKNCKGIFKGVANTCLLNARSKNGQISVMSGEDLCNVGPVAVIQDLAMMATLGIKSVERNGHHYMAGLSQFPKTTQMQVLDAHPTLYIQSEQGWPKLNIQNGEIQLNTVNHHAFGTGFELDLSEFEEISIE